MGDDANTNKGGGTEPAGKPSSPRFRFFLILAMVIVVSAIAVGAALLVEGAEWRWGAGPVLHLLTAGVMLTVSGVCINLLPTAIQAIWKLTHRTADDIAPVLRKLWQPLRKPARSALVVILVAAVLVAVGVVIRPEPTGLEPGKLVVMTAFPPDPGDTRSMLRDQWNRLNPANPVEFDYAAVKADDQHDRMVGDAAPAGEHVADLYVLDVVWMAEFAKRGYIRPLDETRLSDKDLGDFVPKVLATCQLDGKLWALPLNSDVGLMFSRTDIPGVSPPQTWDDYFGASAKATVAKARTTDAKIEAANAAQLSVDDEMLTITALEAIWGAGGLVVGTNGQPALSPDQSRLVFGPTDLLGLKKLADASRDPDLVLTADDEAKKTSAEVAAKTFDNGRTIYMRNWAVARETLDKVASKVTAPPAASVLGGQNLAVSTATRKPRAAQALAQFFANPSSQQILAEGGFVPTRQSSFGYSRRPDADQVRTALDRARPRPVIIHYTEFSRVFREGVNRALNDNGKLEAGFAEKLAEIIKRQ
jgi:multiple sugar transport system substrate-binding protein